MDIVAPSSSAFEIAERLVAPVVPRLTATQTYDLIKRVELALEVAADPPEWMMSEIADRYARWRWHMPLKRLQRLGLSSRLVNRTRYFFRSEIDALAIAQIEGTSTIDRVA
jgi:hypothetical protein